MIAAEARSDIIVDRRVDPRWDYDKRALIRFHPHGALECRVKNISPKGALLRFFTDVIIPNEFQLHIPEDLFIAHCMVRHRSPSQLGVYFANNREQALIRYGSPVRYGPHNAWPVT